MNIKNYIKEKGKKSPYLAFAKNKITQFGDEGIINQLLTELDLFNKNYVVSEFGAWDGVYLSNVYNLWRYNNFNAILIESNQERYMEILEISKNYNNVEGLGVMVDKNSNQTNSFDNIVERSKFKVNDDNFALLCIDVDGPDYAIWESINNYNPIIVVIEIAGGWGVEQEYVGTGASLKSLYKLGLSKNYTLVCATGNAYFVRNDMVSKLKNFDDTATYVDYYINDYMINNILSRIDENGDIKDSIRFLQPFYEDLVNKEKENLYK